MYKKPVLIATYLVCFLVGAALTAMDATPIMVAPAAAQNLQIDTLPQGRHQVSSYRNGSSTEFIVENGEIQMLKIDGQEIPKEEYAEHQERVEEMLGGNRSGDFPGATFDVFRDFNSMDARNEQMQRYFEQQGKQWEKMGEEMSKRLEHMFEFDSEGGSFRFNLEGDEGFEFNLDSLLSGRQFGLPGQGRGYFFDLDDMVEEKEMQRTPEDEIEELETMIEQMERRKAEAQNRMEKEKSGDVVYNGFSFERALKELRADGLIDPGIIRSYEFTNKYLKVNGKRVPEEVHNRMLEDYRKKVNVGRKFTIEHDSLQW